MKSGWANGKSQPNYTDIVIFYKQNHFCTPFVGRSMCLYNQQAIIHLYTINSTLLHVSSIVIKVLKTTIRLCNNKYYILLSFWSHFFSFFQAQKSTFWFNHNLTYCLRFLHFSLPRRRDYQEQACSNERAHYCQFVPRLMVFRLCVRNNIRARSVIVVFYYFFVWQNWCDGWCWHCLSLAFFIFSIVYAVAFFGMLWHSGFGKYRYVDRLHNGLCI